MGAFFMAHVLKKRLFLFAAPNKCHFQPFLIKNVFSKLKALLKEAVCCFYFIACGSNEFKSLVGNEPCKRCGPNSNSLRTSCRCIVDHHRELDLTWDSSSPCYSKFIL